MVVIFSVFFKQNLFALDDDKRLGAGLLKRALHVGKSNRLKNEPPCFFVGLLRKSSCGASFLYGAGREPLIVLYVRVAVNKGAQAEVFLYQGFAYKVYNQSYPAEWIAFEKEQQKAVNKAGLCPVKYYDTDDPHIIKMDLVEGQPLEKSVLNAPEESFKLLARAFRFARKADASGATIPTLSATAGLKLSDEEKSQTLPVIVRLSQKYKSSICHLDMHFLNIMIPNGAELVADKIEYTIIDWMNARVAPPVFDYARTYVIFNEFAKEAVDFYKAAVWPDIQALGISEEDFFDAVKVCAMLRGKEK